MLSYIINIPEQLNGITIKTLLEEYWLIPRKIRHFLRTKKTIQVNGQAINWQSTITTGDIIALAFDNEDYPDKSIPLGNPNLVDCLYEDDHIIIVNKPEGMKTHGNEPTEIALLNHVSAFTQQTCYVVHRLDMETSGVILFAKNPFVLPILNRLLENRQISRRYWALAEGQFSQKRLTYRDPIGRDRHDRRKRLVDKLSGQKAITHVTRLKSNDNCTLVSCQLDTGRTHQIRVHLSHHQHAIIGDPLYSTHKANRLMLHAYELSFTHPFTLEQINIQATSPSFEKVFNQS